MGSEPHGAGRKRQELAAATGDVAPNKRPETAAALNSLMASMPAARAHDVHEKSNLEDHPRRGPMRMEWRVLLGGVTRPLRRWLALW